MTHGLGSIVLFWDPINVAVVVPCCKVRYRYVLQQCKICVLSKGIFAFLNPGLKLLSKTVTFKYFDIKEI